MEQQSRDEPSGTRKRARAEPDSDDDDDEGEGKLRRPLTAVEHSRQTHTRATHTHQPARAMTTIPSRLARLTKSSTSWDQARSASRSLYRQWMRAAPEIVSLYALNIPAYAIRAKVREQFERNQQVSDIKAVDVLLLKGHQDLQETLNCWKMDSHVLRWFAAEEVRSLAPSPPHLPEPSDPLSFSPPCSFPVRPLPLSRTLRRTHR